MTILGIETSCDETAASVINVSNGKVKLLSNILASSLLLHAKTGGVIPEVAAREQVRFIIPVIDEALKVLGKNLDEQKKSLDAIAVTYGPGLIGSLLVGVETAKTLSYVLQKPIIPVNHLFGHIYANWIDQQKEIKFPAICLVVSGGHTDLVLLENHGKLKWLGGTKDDAAGEAFDKIGRLLDLPYPAGPQIEILANLSTQDIYHFPRPMIGKGGFDFSFSGLKSAVMREVEKIKLLNEELSDQDIINICLSTQNAIFDVIVRKTLKACKKYNAKSLLLGGGVAANQTLSTVFRERLEKESLSVEYFVPPKNLSTDNAAMIATSAYFNKYITPWQKVDANPELYFD